MRELVRDPVTFGDDVREDCALVPGGFLHEARVGVHVEYLDVLFREQLHQPRDEG